MSSDNANQSVIGPLNSSDMESLYLDLMSKNLYDENYNREVWIEEPYKLMANIICQIFELSPGDTVLDIGSGAGFLVSILRTRGVRAKGYEFSERMLAQIEPSRREDFQHVTRIEQVPVGDANLLVSMEVFEHIPLSIIKNNLEYFYSRSNCPIFLTIPSFGRDRTVPAAGFYELDVQRQISMRKNELVPYLWLDNGVPGAGHITLAGFQWWEDIFLIHGFYRDAHIEYKFKPFADIIKAYHWCPYVLQRLQINKVAIGRGWIADDCGYWASFNAELVFKIDQDAEIELSIDLPDINYSQESSVIIVIEQLILIDAAIDKRVVLLKNSCLDGRPVMLPVKFDKDDQNTYRLRLYSPMFVPNEVDVGDDIRPRGVRLLSAKINNVS